MTKTIHAATSLEFKKVSASRPETIAILSLHRPQLANAFNGEMVTELQKHLTEITHDQNCRLMLLRGTGRNFCAGADLGWMKDFADLSHAQNTVEAKSMTYMFELLYRMPKPTIAITQGAVYGGAVGLVAACDSAIALDDSKFCLSEVRVGLIPAVITPYVSRKLASGQMRRHMLSGRVFSAAEAKTYGLVEQVCSSSDLEKTLRDEINQFLAASPDAQVQAKQLFLSLADQAFAQSTTTAEAIATVRTSPSGQAGTKAFLSKQKPGWSVALDDQWSADD